VIRALFRLVLGLLLAGAVLWFALPAAASSLAGVAVSAAGLTGDDISASVAARPPLKLLLLEADSIRVRSGAATWRGMRFGSLDVTIADIRLGGSPQRIDGTIRDVEFADDSGATVRATSIALSGAAATPDVEVTMSDADVSALVGRALPATLGGAGARITLASPSGVHITTAGGEATARIALRADGGLDLVVTVGAAPPLTLTLLAPGAAIPLRVSEVRVDGANLVLRGSADTRSLGL
jgi:hypothetical protein